MAASAIPGWQRIIKKPYKDAPNLIIHYNHVSKDTRVFTLDKLTSTEIYSILISKVQNKPSSNIYFENLFDDNDSDWVFATMLTYV